MATRQCYYHHRGRNVIEEKEEEEEEFVGTMVPRVRSIFRECEYFKSIFNEFPQIFDSPKDLLVASR